MFSFSLKSNPNIKEIHNNLLAKLINGHVGHKENSDSYVRWKMQFRNFCDLPTQQNGSVLENVFYLEDKGLLDICKYDVLQKIFSEDIEALSEIERVSTMIENIDPSTIRSTGMLTDLICFKNSILLNQFLFTGTYQIRKLFVSMFMDYDRGSLLCHVYTCNLLVVNFVILQNCLSLFEIFSGAFYIFYTELILKATCVHAFQIAV